MNLNYYVTPETGLTGQSLQFSVPGEFEGLANNLRKPVGEAVGAFAQGRIFCRVLSITIFAVGVAALFANDPLEARS